MKKNILLLALCLNFLMGYGQTNKLNSNTVFKELYPRERNFENDTILIRKVNRDGIEYIFKTEVGKIFYYKVGLIQKATVILYSYDFTEGFRKDCHACHPEIEIATYALINDKWVQQKFIQNWGAASGTWGEPCEITLTIYKNIKCLALNLEYVTRGKFNKDVHRYDIETLKEIR